MTETQFKILNELVITPLRKNGAQVFIFGSRSVGTHHPYSDVDLLYKIDHALPAGVLAKIKEDIEESHFPFTVDLVADSDLAQSYRQNVSQQLQEILD